MAQYDINLREYWRILKKRKPIVIITAIVLGFFSTFFAVIQAPTPLYTSACSIKFERETTIEGLYAKTISWSAGDDIETQISIITSYPVLQEVAQRLGLIPDRDDTEEDRLKSNVIGIIEGLKGKVVVSREGYTNILNIFVTDPNPNFAQRLANTLASTYKEMHSKQLNKRTTDAIRYIDNQLNKTRQKLRESEERFNRFSQENQLLSIDMQSENLLLRTKEFDDEIRKVNEDKRELESVLGRVSRFIKNPSGSDTDFYSSRANRQYQATNDNLVGLLLKKDTLLEDYTAQHPEVIGISQKINETARKMLILLRLQINDLEKKNIDLRRELEKVGNKTNLLMDKKLEYNRLKREVESYRDMTALLEQKNQEALIRKAEKPEEVVIVKPALLPSTPINPPKTATTGAMGAFIGIVLGLIIAFIVETFDTSLGAIEDVEETLGAQVLGVIPQADAKAIHESMKDQYPEDIDEHSITKIVNLVSHFAPKTMVAESFRALRTNIQFKFKEGEKKIRTIAVTSTSPQEGKTLVSVNLAISLAQAGTKVLLVGSDLRKPMVGRIFGLEISPGLTDVLLGNYSWRDTVKTITDIIMGKISLEEVMLTPGIDNLHIITSGTIPPNPAELIESKRLTGFIEEAKNEYDIIIFDTSPILSTADAAILGTKVDGVLLVYRIGTVSRGLLKRSSTQLKQVKCNIIGVVLNGMKPEISPDFQNFKYYRYYYSYGEEEKERRGGSIKKAFSFVSRGRGDSREPQESHISPRSVEEGSRDEQGKGINIFRSFLILVGLTFLTVGLLWQNGVIDPLRLLASHEPVKEEDLKPSVIKKSPKPMIQKMPKDISGNAKGTIPVERPAVPQESQVVQAKLERKTEVAIEEARSPERPLKYPYSLYLGSYRTLELAKKAVETYSKKDLSSYWTRVTFKKKGVWYRVFMGHFEDSRQAESFRQEHGLKEATTKETQYTNLIGTYGHTEELQEKVISLRKLGYSPYVIEGPEGESRLFVGAFVTEEGAEVQNNDLKSNSVQSQVIKR